MPSEGGIPKRLTYTATLDRDDVSDRMGPNNIVMGWKDGSQIVYRSRKDQWNDFKGDLLLVSAGRRLVRAVAAAARRILFLFAGPQKAGLQPRLPRIPHLEALSRRAGGRRLDLRFRQQTDNQHHRTIRPRTFSRCGPGTRFISFPTGTKTSDSIFTGTISTASRPQSYTSFVDFDIKFPSLGDDAIVFENGGYIYRFDLKSQKAEKIPISIADDQVIGRGGWIDVSRQITNYEISPDGSRALFGARGEIFTVPAKYGNTRNLTNTSGIHERASKWSPDGKWIAYISDASGEDEIYIVPQDGSGPAKQLTTGADTYKFSLLWSPDSQKLLWSDKKLRLQYVDVDSGKRDAGRAGESVGNYRFQLVSGQPVDRLRSAGRAEDADDLSLLVREKGNLCRDRWLV